MHAWSSRYGSPALEDTHTGDHPNASRTASDLNGFDLTYYGSSQDEEELSDLVRELTEMGNTSWAQIGEKELRQRQGRVPSILHGVLKIMGRATGAEMHANSLWNDGQGTKVCSASTERISAFIDSDDARKARSEFISFIRESLG
ncbi:hypothetical protein FRC10_010346 [Ceratobasidium sp. 414]|nr:hypothetical protein FRC10_010346 [Ceratobasidium sp. 414]